MKKPGFFKKTPLSTSWLYLSLLLIIWGTGPALIDTCKSAQEEQIGCVFSQGKLERSIQWIQADSNRSSCPSCPGCSDENDTPESCTPAQRPAQPKRSGEISVSLRLHKAVEIQTSSALAPAVTRLHAIPTLSNPKFLRTVVLLT